MRADSSPDRCDGDGLIRQQGLCRCRRDSVIGIRDLDSEVVDADLVLGAVICGTAGGIPHGACGVLSWAVLIYIFAGRPAGGPESAPRRLGSTSAGAWSSRAAAGLF